MRPSRRWSPVVAGCWAGAEALGAALPACSPHDHLPSPQIRDIGSGNFGVAKLCRAKDSGELVAVKFIERGEKVRRWSGCRRAGRNVCRRGAASAAAERSRSHSLPVLHLPLPCCR